LEREQDSPNESNEDEEPSAGEEQPNEHSEAEELTDDEEFEQINYATIGEEFL
jgi:hypothetical protein